MENGLALQLLLVNRSIGKHQIVRDITLNVNRSEIFGLLGPSGSGKTTLVKLISGIDIATSGEIILLGQQMPRLSMMQRVGYMAQSDALYAELTALENLEFFAALFGLRGADRKNRISEVMQLVNLHDHLKKPVHQYSGGMKRRLSLAVSLLHEPEVLLLDEPTVGIDPVLRQSIWNELEKISKKGTTIVVTTHVMDEAEKCHRLGMLREGSLIAMGTPRELKEKTNASTLEEAFLTYGGARV